MPYGRVEQAQMKALIVEDDVDLVETYTDLLEAHGYSIISVLRAADAIRVATREKPNLIILDLNLPGDSGGLVLNFVRRYPPIAKTKIIVATGQPEMVTKLYAIHKADAILTKPIANHILIHTLDRLLGNIN
jgi:two-component system, OmpR family, alkaline phosphatase synthesis response regulator PhoP